MIKRKASKDCLLQLNQADVPDFSKIKNPICHAKSFIGQAELFSAPYSTISISS